MRSILLTKNSSFQIYFANQLYDKNIIDTIFIEDGSSVDSRFILNKSIMKRKNILSHLRLLIYFIKQPINLFYFFFKVSFKYKFFGYNKFYDKKILKSNYKKFNKKLSINFIDNFNEEIVINSILDLKPKCIYVFGTSIISSTFIRAVTCPIINLHWGDSSKYRGEGIISSLAFEGKNGPAITIHCISEEVDAGKILYQKKPKIVSNDNFYSIGLKLTVLSIKCFEEINEKIKNNLHFNYIENDSKRSFYYNSEYMRRNPSLYYKAWKNLKKNI